MKRIKNRLIAICLASWCLLLPGGAFAAEDNIAEAARSIARGLSDRLQSHVTHVLIGNLTLQDTRLSSEFADHMKRYLEAELKRSGDFKSVKLQRTMRTRAFSFREDEEVPQREEFATLSGRYWLAGDSLFVSTHLLNAKGKKLSEYEVEIARSAIPWSVVPENMDKVRETESRFSWLPALTSDFPVRLQIDRGNGGVYRNGERLRVFFRTSRDCHLRVLYIDADQNWILMYPTKRDNEKEMLKVDREYSLHARNEYTVRPPFGSESIRAFCSSRRQRLDKAVALGGGFRGFDKTARIGETINSLRGLGVAGPLETAEAIVYLTTIP